uniref:Uncharacterized protein n=1 Tax=Manihot esculenta TaxID=3983 RepID=A0A2C9UHE1_MANES
MQVQNQYNEKEKEKKKKKKKSSSERDHPHSILLGGAGIASHFYLHSRFYFSPHLVLSIL